MSHQNLSISKFVRCIFKDKVLAVLLEILLSFALDELIISEHVLLDFEELFDELLEGSPVNVPQFAN